MPLLHRRAALDFSVDVEYNCCGARLPTSFPLSCRPYRLTARVLGDGWISMENMEEAIKIYDPAL